MLSIDDAAGMVSARLGREVTRRELAYPFLEIDQQAIYDAHAESVTYEVWDQESPINGRTADEVRAHRNDLTDSAYLIYVDGDLVYFQPTHPSTGDPLTAEEAEDVAASHVEQIIHERAVGDIIVSLARMVDTPVNPAIPVSPAMPPGMDQELG